MNELYLQHDKAIWKQQPCVFVNTVQIFITDKCNKRCKGCFNEERLGTEDMSMETYKRVIGHYSHYVKKVILMGGEPLMHDNIKEMIKLNQSTGLRTTIYTNGSFLYKLNGIDLTGVTIRIGVLGLENGEKNLMEITPPEFEIELTYMLRQNNIKELKPTIKYFEDNFNCKKIMLSSIRNITDSGDYWVDGDGDLTFQEYFDIAQNFVNTYSGRLSELQVSIRGNMVTPGGDCNKCRFINIFPNGDKIICPFDICKNIKSDVYTFPDRKCDKNKRCLLQKIILKKRRIDMPIYVYFCEKCKEKHEILCKMDKKDKQVCPTCGGKLKNIVVSGGFIVNGASYANGYVCKKKK